LEEQLAKLHIDSDSLFQEKTEFDIRQKEAAMDASHRMEEWKQQMLAQVRAKQQEMAQAEAASQQQQQHRQSEVEEKAKALVQVTYQYGISTAL
jgi:hypothetical protein